MIYDETDLDYLLPDLRLQINDYTAPYTYETPVLRQALVAALETLGRRWNYRYCVSTLYAVSRNSNIIFEYTSPPIIETSDKRLIVLQAAIVMRTAEMSDTVWNIGSWKDDEIYYSNVAAGNRFTELIARDKEELETLLKRRLYPGKRQSLPGFIQPFNVREG